jgi:hypothetical protein
MPLSGKLIGVPMLRYLLRVAPVDTHELVNVPEADLQ